MICGSMLVRRGFPACGGFRRGTLAAGARVVVRVLALTVIALVTGGGLRVRRARAAVTGRVRRVRGLGRIW